MPEDRKKRRHIEREFGVPFAGEILEPNQWTQTALKKLPSEGPLDLPGLFGRSAPLIVDLGCGNGRFLIGSAVWRPDRDHLGPLSFVMPRGGPISAACTTFASPFAMPSGCWSTIYRYRACPRSIAIIHNRIMNRAKYTCV